MASFTIYKDGKGEYRWRFRANNNEIIADSAEGYKAKKDCQTGIDILKREAGNATTKDDTD